MSDGGRYLSNNVAVTSIANFTVFPWLFESYQSNITQSVAGPYSPASLFLEDVVDLLKRLFALRVAQDISS